MFYTCFSTEKFKKTTKTKPNVPYVSNFVNVQFLMIYRLKQSNQAFARLLCYGEYIRCYRIMQISPPPPSLIMRSNACRSFA